MHELVLKGLWAKEDAERRGDRAWHGSDDAQEKGTKLDFALRLDGNGNGTGEIEESDALIEDLMTRRTAGSRGG